MTKFEFHHCDEEKQGNPEYMISKYPDGKWYFEDLLYDNMSEITYCPYCGVKLEEKEC